MRRGWVTRTITVPGNLGRACDQFNAHAFWDCHETLEEVWQEEQGDVRDLYKGLIQLAAAFYHVTNGNYRGADRLLATGLGYLDPYRPAAMGLDVEGICAAAGRAHARLRADGPAAVTLRPELLPVLAIDEAALPGEALRWRPWGFDGEGAPLAMEIDIPE